MATKLRRSRFLDLRLKDQRCFDLDSFLAGKLDIRYGESKVLARAHLAGVQTLLDSDELSLLMAVPESDWLSIHDLDTSVLREKTLDEWLDKMESNGLVLSDSDSPSSRASVSEHDRFVENHWSREAFRFFMDVNDIESRICTEKTPTDYRSKVATAALDANSFIEEKRSPPELFYTYDHGARIRLSPGELEGQLFELLENRRTERFFDSTKAITREQISSILFHSFGTQELFQISDQYFLQKKTSPSGGGLHPIEAFPIVLKAEGINSGIYHYDSRSHQLSVVKYGDELVLRQLSEILTQEQGFVGNAHLLVILAARWRRNFWKYRQRPNTFNVIMMDAGHLGQTFNLTCAALGLGSFWTAALNRTRIAEVIGKELSDFGAIAICGCGIPDTTAPQLASKKLDRTR